MNSKKRPQISQLQQKSGQLRHHLTYLTGDRSCCPEHLGMGNIPREDSVSYKAKQLQ